MGIKLVYGRVEARRGDDLVGMGKHVRMVVERKDFMGSLR